MPHSQHGADQFARRDPPRQVIDQSQRDPPPPPDRSYHKKPNTKIESSEIKNEWPTWMDADMIKKVCKSNADLMNNNDEATLDNLAPGTLLMRTVDNCRDWTRIDQGISVPNTFFERSNKLANSTDNEKDWYYQITQEALNWLSLTPNQKQPARL